MFSNSIICSYYMRLSPQIDGIKLVFIFVYCYDCAIFTGTNLKKISIKSMKYVNLEWLSIVKLT
jgi:hypothetical protein